MKLLLTPALFFFFFAVKAQNFFEDADAFFASYVTDGRVDYKSLREEPQALDNLVDAIANHDLTNKRVTGDYVKAFYINAYNLLVIKQVVDSYPIAGPLEVDGFFDKITNMVMGEKMTLNQLEKETLYRQFPDPRLHFVLVCAAKGCPPVASFAFKPNELEEQLQERTAHVLNLNWFVVVVNEKKVQLSQIFSWYASDFKETSLSLIAYINEYRQVKISEKSRVGYYEYDWTLNDK